MRTIRTVTTGPGDEGFLAEMLVEAFAWRPEATRPTVTEVLAIADVALYIEGWGRTGDRGVIAEQGGHQVGAAWRRLFADERHGYGFLGPSVPELALAVRPEARGNGIGLLLLAGLIAQAREDGTAALSLSVEQDNPARRLYERFGFVLVSCNENALTMRLDLVGVRRASALRLR